MKKSFKYLIMLTFMKLALVVFLTGCGSGGDVYEGLFGRWRTPTFPAVTYTFNEDGTGSRTGETFTWSVSGQTLRINRDRQYVQSGEIRNERWDFSIGTNRRLNLTSQQQRGLTFNMDQIGIVDELFVGTWTWNENPEWRYVLNETGGGNRGFEGNTDSFSWGIANGQLRIFILATTGVSDSWYATITGDTLRLENAQDPSEVYYYTRQ